MNVTLDVSTEELVEIAQLLDRRRKNEAFLATSPSLTEEEKKLAINRPIDAMKSVRARLGCTFVAAKVLIDAERDTKR
jgi:hypothetical protein